MNLLNSMWFVQRRPIMAIKKSTRKLRSLLSKKDEKMANDTAAEVTIPAVEPHAVESTPEPVVERALAPTAEQIANQEPEKIDTRALGRQAWITAGKPK